MAKTNRQDKVDRRAKRAAKGEREIKDKFLEERERKINNSPLVPMNELQKEYINLIRDKQVVIATGFAGTSKTYIPTVIACDKYLMGEIDQIYITRPAVSNSKSLGYFSGDLVEKMSNWLGPVLTTMKERLGQGTLEVAIKNGDITFLPFEVLKGYSFKNCFVLCDEAEDVTVDEAKKFITRIGENCTAVLAGDVTQSELKDRSGLVKLVELIRKTPMLESTSGLVDFNRPSDIVRSRVCKEWILAFRSDESDGKA